ncbi:unnamed protein product [Arabis nemorensis]|uniref:Uncharacterized protein n=1 Tax=Arabis nemorensis TaxID=586526 RepID=A0A565C2Y8_9BRAS|nr:unnamed protein product [Arabis nemorensis]
MLLSLGLKNLRFLSSIIEISRRNSSSSNKFTDIQRRLRSLVLRSPYCPIRECVCVISCGGYKRDGEEIALIDEIFSELRKRVAGKVQKWREAIIELAHTDDCKWIARNEFKLIEEIVRYACLRLFSISSQNVIDVYSLLESWQPSGMQMIGIWGMPGVGKTTVAKEIFRRLAPGYDSCYFLQDFHLIYQTKGLTYLRDEFFSKLFGVENLLIDACDTKPSFMKDRFQSKTVLVVIDDVTNARDAEALVGGFDWFSHGHLIILTSRNRQVLVQCNVKELYKIQNLFQYQSSQFLSLCAPGQYESMLNSELVRYASGIPLVLSVLGSFVRNQFTEKEHLQMLRQIPPTEIQDAFRRSFDGLNENEKNIFLDLASFFRGDNRNHVIQILDGCGFFTELGIYGLIDESLIDPLDDKIEMSNVFQDMGRFVVCEESKEPGKRSRLWDGNEIAKVLRNNSGTEAVEGIFMDMSNLKCKLGPTIFERTYRLRLLKLHCSTSGNHCNLCLPQGLNSLPDELRLLHWESYPLRSLPRHFNPKNLVELNMPYSKMEKLWKGTKNLEKLKKIRLSHSRQLTKIPRLSKALNLEHIDLEGCTSLVKVTSSIHHLDKLVFLNLRDCSRLRSLPVMIHLESLEFLDLSGCSDLEDIQDFSPNLKELYLAGTAIREMPSSIENLTKLVTLDLENCDKLLHLPPGISNLKAMVTLKLSGCSKLKRVPNLDAISLIGSDRLNTEQQVLEPLVHHSAIQESMLDVCETLDKLQFRLEIQIRQQNWAWFTITPQPLSIFHFLASRFYALVSLFLSNACLMDIPEEICELPTVNALDFGGNSISKIPESIRLLPRLHSLSLRHCKNLKSLPELPQSLELLNVHGCVSLKSVPWRFKQLLMHCTFSNCFKLSPEVFRGFLAKSLCIVENMKRDRHQKLITEPAFSICVPASEDLKSSTDVFASEVEFEFCPVDSQNEVLDDNCEVKGCGVYVITDASGDMSLVKKRFSPIKRERSGKKLLSSSMDPGAFSSGREPLPRFKRGRYRRSVESAILKLRKRKREESFSTSNQS